MLADIIIPSAMVAVTVISLGMSYLSYKIGSSIIVESKQYEYVHIPVVMGVLVIGSPIMLGCGAIAIISSVTGISSFMAS